MFDEITQLDATMQKDNISLLQEIIDYRYNRHLCTVLVGNLKAEEKSFRHFLGSSITDRIMAKDNFIFSLEENSFRRQFLRVVRQSSIIPRRAGRFAIGASLCYGSGTVL
jgi:hypothetical protein